MWLKIREINHTMHFILTNFKLFHEEKMPFFLKKKLKSNLVIGKNIEILLVSKQYITILCNFPNL